MPVHFANSSTNKVLFSSMNNVYFGSIDNGNDLSTMIVNSAVNAANAAVASASGLAKIGSANTFTANNTFNSNVIFNSLDNMYIGSATTANRIVTKLSSALSLSSYALKSGTTFTGAVTFSSTANFSNTVNLNNNTTNSKVVLPALTKVFVESTTGTTLNDLLPTITNAKAITITGITGASITSYYARYGSICFINFSITKSQTGAITTSKVLTDLIDTPSANMTA